MITAFVIGSLAAAAVGLPVDFLRRRAGGAFAALAGLVSAVALIGLVAALAGAHVLAGGLAIPALVLGLIAGNVAADGVATRVWGPARKQA